MSAKLQGRPTSKQRGNIQQKWCPSASRGAGEGVLSALCLRPLAHNPHQEPLRNRGNDQNVDISICGCGVVLHLSSFHFLVGWRPINWPRSPSAGGSGVGTTWHSGAGCGVRQIPRIVVGKGCISRSMGHDGPGGGGSTARHNTAAATAAKREVAGDTPRARHLWIGRGKGRLKSCTGHQLQGR